MSTPSVPSAGLVPAAHNRLSSLPSQFPEMLRRTGQAAVFAAEEFFYGRIRNEHTRAAYLIAVRRFLRWAEARGLELGRIAPRDVGQYLDWLRKENTSVATRKQHLAAKQAVQVAPKYYSLVGCRARSNSPANVSRRFSKSSDLACSSVRVVLN